MIFMPLRGNIRNSDRVNYFTLSCIISDYITVLAKWLSYHSDDYICHCENAGDVCQKHDYRKFYEIRHTKSQNLNDSHRKITPNMQAPAKSEALVPEYILSKIFGVVRLNLFWLKVMIIEHDLVQLVLVIVHTLCFVNVMYVLVFPLCLSHGSWSLSHLIIL